MGRKKSILAPEWWDYTTLDDEILDDAAALTADDMAALSREGFRVVFYDTLEDFYLAEALEYVTAWKQATPDNPVGICGPIGPTEQLPLVARLVNELDLNLANAHFWGMDEWVMDGAEVAETHALSFARADRELCFDRIRPELKMPDANIHFPKADTSAYMQSWEGVRCAVMQGGQGDIKHWAFNDPVRREGEYADQPPRRVRRPAADAGAIPQAHDPRGGPASCDRDAKRTHQRRRCRNGRADAGGYRGTGRDLAGRKSLDLAGGHARQPLRHAADHPDDRQENRRQRRAHVAAGRSPQRPVQLLPPRHRHVRSGDALRAKHGDTTDAC